MCPRNKGASRGMNSIIERRVSKITRAHRSKLKKGVVIPLRLLQTNNVAPRRADAIFAHINLMHIFRIIGHIILFWTNGEMIGISNWRAHIWLCRGKRCLAFISGRTAHGRGPVVVFWDQETCFGFVLFHRAIASLKLTKDALARCKRYLHVRSKRKF
jgi:hypothetical protein